LFPTIASGFAVIPVGFVPIRWSNLEPELPDRRSEADPERTA
jgi:hypothetical protein